MADLITNNELANALVVAKQKAKDGVLKGSDLDRPIREYLQNKGCLAVIIRGWYLLTKPGVAGSSTAWFGGFWRFLRLYLVERFGEAGYCLSAESSVDLITGDGKISKQITILTTLPSNHTVTLPHNTSILLYTETKKFPDQIEQTNGVNTMPLALALCRLMPVYFKNCSLTAEIALKLVPSASDISRVLIEEKAVTAGGRLAGAYKHLGDDQKSEQIVKDMAAANLAVEVENPFTTEAPRLGMGRLLSPYSGRIEAMWASMRSTIESLFPHPPGISKDPQRTIRFIQEIYRQDAYHSLSIEGYQVTDELIVKIAKGEWAPETDESDKGLRDALAAKGYSMAFDTVTKSIIKVLNNINPGEVVEKDLQSWYRDLFTPVVQAGILLKASELAGFRNGPVYIEGSRHVPPGSHAVTDSMETLFKLLKQEKHAGVRAILGNFIFVYIHPYSDGNGRIGRFILNLMLISGGYPWTVVRTSERTEYMRSLESASIDGDIAPFTNFIAQEMRYWESIKFPKIDNSRKFTPPDPNK